MYKNNSRDSSKFKGCSPLIFKPKNRYYDEIIFYIITYA